MTTPARRPGETWLEAAAREAHATIGRLHAEAYADLVRTAERYAGEMTRRQVPPSQPPRTARRR
ncbi:hypothetical protein [Amycolatopsis minnesotensis]|uniref:Uncharacterized protein n=1 Tax=Amycolatopsis minnesotensis TaxID=337894 RepID=A0ABN2QAL2_9PSEU